jgi:hypothetical protein
MECVHLISVLRHIFRAGRRAAKALRKALRKALYETFGGLAERKAASRGLAPLFRPPDCEGAGVMDEMAVSGRRHSIDQSRRLCESRQGRAIGDHDAAAAAFDAMFGEA